jgi:2'-5' RNA ligase
MPRRFAPRREQLEALKRSARHPLWWLPDPGAQQEEAYRRVWQNLRTISEVRDGRHDTDAWRARTGPFAMCAVRVPASALVPEIEELRNALRAFPYARIHPDSFLHVPIQELGFLSEDPKDRNELDRHRLDEFIEMARRPLVDFPKIPIVLGPVNSFADAAFLDVDDDGWLSRIHRRLLDFVTAPPNTRYPYLPHVTIAHYDRSAPIGNLPAVLAEWRDRPLGEFVVEQVDVVTLDTQETFPPFSVVHEFKLGTTRATGSFPTRPEPGRD